MRLKSDLILMLVALIWGVAFVAQRVAAQFLGGFLFNGARFLLAVLILLPLIRFRWSVVPAMRPWVALAGALLFGASWLQQTGLQFTTAGNAGFITGTYVVLVPLMMWGVWRQRIPRLVWAAAALALVGIALLSMSGEFRLAPGDGLELAGSLFWALHVILVGWIVQRVEVLQFAIGQYAVAGALSLVVGLGFESQTLSGLAGAGWANVGWAIAYTGVLSTAVGYTLQAVGQRHSPPSDAALILSLEAVFAALSGYALLHEALSPRQMLGCGLIFGAIVLSQVRSD
jgi:drug/metabolite transporter (DMT)-like permease